MVVYLLDFDGLADQVLQGEEDQWILVAPYQQYTKILSTKEVDEDKERKKLLDALSRQIAKPHEEGMGSGCHLCHFPIHGIRVYSGGELLHEGTFCWTCDNFSFSYPEGTTWLDTTAGLEGLFTALIPIPQWERDRFAAKYGGLKPGQGKPAAEPAPK